MALAGDHLQRCGAATTQGPEAAAEKFRLQWTQNAEHIPPTFLPNSSKRATSTWLIDYFPIIEQGLADLIQWVEEGVAPPNTTFEFVDGQVRLPATAAERGGVQPVVSVTANGGLRAEVKAGEAVQLEVAAEVPPNGGTIVSVEWDFDGWGSFPFHHDVDGSDTSVHLSTTHTYDTPGTYFATALVHSNREGKVDAEFRRLPEPRIRSDRRQLVVLTSLPSGTSWAWFGTTLAVAAGRGGLRLVFLDLSAQVGGADDLGRQHLLGRPLEDHLAEVEHVHLLAGLLDQGHVVLDEEQANPHLVDDSLQDLAEVLGLGCIEPGRGLVEEDGVEGAGEDAGQLDEPPLPGAEMLDTRIEVGLDSRQFDRRRGRRLRSPAHRRGVRRPGAAGCPPRAHTPAPEPRWCARRATRRAARAGTYGPIRAAPARIDWPA